MKLAACFLHDIDQCREAVLSMITAQTDADEQMHHRKVVPGGCFAWLPGGERSSSVPLVQEWDNGNFLLICGVPITHDGNLKHVLRRTGELRESEAVSLLTSLEGAFAALFWDAQQEKLHLVTDILGMQPFYMRHKNDYLLLSSELKGQGAVQTNEPVLDACGWGGFLAFGHPLGSDTMLQGVKKTPPGSVLTYSPADDLLTAYTYWQWPDSRRYIRLDDVPVQNLVDLISADIQGYQEHSDESTILMSGGFDSRIILSILDAMGRKPNALIISHIDENNNADGRIAQALANSLQLKTKTVTPDRDFYSSNEYLRYLLQNEVATPSLYLFITHVAAAITKEMQAVWEGVFPGFSLVPPHQPPGGFRPYMEQECSFWGDPVWKAARQIFNSHLAQSLHDGFQESLKREQSVCSDDGYGVSKFIVTNRARNRTAPNPLLVYMNKTLAFTPGLNKEFWSIIANTAYDIRSDFKLYFRLFETCFPKALEFPFCSGKRIINSQANDHIHLTKPFLNLLFGDRVAFSAQRWITWNSSNLIGKTLSKIDPDHPDLNADTVRQLQRGSSLKALRYRHARHLLFYWQIWRWIMSGQLTFQKLNSGSPL